VRRHALPRETLVLYAVLIAANLAAWGWALAAFHGHPALLGLGLLAYSLGLRHAVDADHIAAIDNVTRKLMHEGQRPIAVGFFFALGHSSVVVVAATAIAASTATLEQRYPGLVEIGGVIGTGASVTFLFAIAAANGAVLVALCRMFARLKRGDDHQADELQALLARRGLIAQALRRLFRLISRSWHMFPLGLLFGLGFDTASEIGLLGIAASEAAKGLPVWSILAFPLLFAAGMSLVDTSDGVLMVGAYGWAFANPVRRLSYNLAVTGMSVIVALLVGGVETLGLVADKLGLSGSGGFIDAASDHLDMLGYVIVAVFAASWGLAALIYRFKGYDRISA